MARVFSYEAIESGRVPKIDDFALADNLITSGLLQLFQDEEIYGCVRFGSVGHGEPSIRSDYDLFGIVRDTGRQKVREIFRLAFRKTQVVVEPIIIQEDQARTGILPIQSGLQRHIGRMVNDRNLIGKNPLEVLPPPAQSVLPDFRSYLFGKMVRLNKGFYDVSGSERLKTIQRSLEAPANLGRVTLEVFGELNKVDLLKDGDGKSRVVTLFRDVFRKGELTKKFDVILEQDAIYGNLLNEAVQGRVSRGLYDTNFSKIESVVVLAAIEWVEQVGRAYSNDEFISR